ncbi:hypothetical protein DSO57_1013678 [Entomophthora muscae]|uniref:Uncharacterized protein n=1 Tax=Entomophthora muscae TaxID=34485 RepID=A0ACC2SUN4_9FUNG|nr:hypothetical protein DSO57_1013678 [Entomophthora muscae]
MFKFNVFLFSSVALAGVLTCPSVATRQEIRTLTSTQLTKYFNAVNALKDQGNFYSESCAIHNDNVAQAHGVPAFFPWHRRFLRNYELALQAIDPTIIIPYWDWTIDSQAPEQSTVLSSSYFGGNGRSSDNCLDEGPFSGWNSTIPDMHCLKRQYNSDDMITAFYSPEAIEAILSQSTTYDQVHTSIEGGPHGAVHNGIGGDDGDMIFMYSPNDPIFYAHHAFIDLLWNEWQIRNPSLANTYTGESTDNMIPFNVPVSSVFNTKASGFCYTYPRWNANLPAAQLSSLHRRQDNTLTSLIDILKSNIAQLISIAPTDRTTHQKIRTPSPLPQAYIDKNNLNIDKVRSNEKSLARLVETLNATPNFVPKAHLKL